MLRPPWAYEMRLLLPPWQQENERAPSLNRHETRQQPQLPGERGEDGVGLDYLREASLSHLVRIATERRFEATSEWIQRHTGHRRRYRPPKGGKMRKALARTRKELAGRFHQLLSGHAATTEHLLRVGQASSDYCF